MKKCKTSIIFCVIISSVVFGCAPVNNMSVNEESTHPVELIPAIESPSPTETINITEVINDPGPSMTLTVTPQKKIVSGNLIFECDNEIYRFDMPERNFTQLVHDTENMFYNLAWDGNNIFYTKSTKSMITRTANMGISFGPYNIHKVKIDGGDNISVTNDSYYKQFLNVNPNSKYLVFQIITEENRLQLIIFDQENGTEKIIWDEDYVEAKTFPHFPYWSPDGTRIAILVYPNLHIYDLETDTTSQLATGHEIVDSHPAWSPDGKSIVVGVRKRNTETDENEYSFAIINAIDGEVDEIILLEKGFRPSEFAWSPDGKRIVFGETQRLEESRLVSWELDTGEFFILHTGTGQEQVLDYHAVWSSDSESIAYFSETSESLPNLIVQDVKTQEILISQEILDSTGCYNIVDMLWIDTP